MLECAPPSGLAYSWVGGNVDTRATYQIEPEGEGTRSFLEQSGFDLSAPSGHAARQGAQTGWGYMLARLAGVIASMAGRS